MQLDYLDCGYGQYAFDLDDVEAPKCSPVSVLY
jgi:hypothetical protein